MESSRAGESTSKARSPGARHGFARDVSANGLHAPAGPLRRPVEIGGPDSVETDARQVPEERAPEAYSRRLRSDEATCRSERIGGMPFDHGRLEVYRVSLELIVLADHPVRFLGEAFRGWERRPPCHGKRFEGGNGARRPAGSVSRVGTAPAVPREAFRGENWLPRSRGKRFEAKTGFPRSRGRRFEAATGSRGAAGAGLGGAAPPAGTRQAKTHLPSPAAL